MREKFPALPISHGAVMFFDGKPVNREFIVQMFWSLKNMLMGI